MRKERRYIIYLWIFVYTSQIGVCTFNYFSPTKSLETQSLPVFPSRNFPAKKPFTFPATFKFDDASKKPPYQVTQKVKVRFPKLGLIEVRSVEQSENFPRIEFVNPKTKHFIGKINVGTSESNLFILKETSTKNNPYVRFKVLRANGLLTPLIFAVATYHGGSDSAFVGTIIGEVNGKIKELATEQMFVNNQGGIFVGNLGNGKGFGAVSWNFIWGNDFLEGHYSYHHYEAEIYSFDNKTNLFKKTKTMRTKRKYGGRGEEALIELKLPVKDLLQTVPDLEYLGRYKEIGF